MGVVALKQAGVKWQEFDAGFQRIGSHLDNCGTNHRLACAARTRVHTERENSESMPSLRQSYIASSKNVASCEPVLLAI